MSNEQLIKSAHIWAVAVVLFGAIAFATKAGSHPAHLAQENQNANSNTNTSRNQNQNSNATTNRNTNNSNETAAAAGSGALSSKDQKFLMDAAMGGLMEVELGRWAAQVGTSPEVKQFGQRMIDDHKKANAELAQLASSKGVTVPTQLDEKHQRDVSKIARLKGADFDRAYSKAMLSDHEKDVKEFEKQSTNATDPDVKAFAAKTLPTLQEHLQMVRALPGNTKPADSNANANANRNSNN
jgi:putative membrane protein